jgi:hypothetical protein
LGETWGSGTQGSRRELVQIGFAPWRNGHLGGVSGVGVRLLRGEGWGSLWSRSKSPGGNRQQEGEGEGLEGLGEGARGNPDQGVWPLSGQKLPEPLGYHLRREGGAQFWQHQGRMP